jgi:hypothetical protein
MRAGVDEDLGCLPEGIGRMFIRMVQDALKEGRRGSRLALAQTDKVVEVRAWRGASFGGKALVT